MRRSSFVVVGCLGAVVVVFSICIGREGAAVIGNNYSPRTDNHSAQVDDCSPLADGSGPRAPLLQSSPEVDAFVWRVVAAGRGDSVGGSVGGSTGSTGSVGAVGSVVDFGEVYSGLEARARLVLARPGNGPANGAGVLRFGRLLVDCDCVEAELSARSVGAGEDLFLTIRLHSGGLPPGERSHSVAVEMLEPEERLLRADIAAEIIPAPTDTLWRPSAFFVPSDVPAGVPVGVPAGVAGIGGGVGVDKDNGKEDGGGEDNGELFGEVLLMNLSPSPLRIDGLAAAGDGISVVTKAPLALAAGSSRTILVRRAAGSGAAADDGVWVSTDRPGRERFLIPWRGP